MLSALELSLGFRTVSAYLRTYHNVTEDDLTRDDPKEVAKAKGLEKLPTVDWSHFFSRGWTKRSILWEGQLDQDTDTALQLAYRRSPPGPRDFVFVIWDCTPPSAALARAAITASLKGKVVVPLGNTLNPTGADPIFHGEVLPAALAGNLVPFARVQSGILGWSTPTSQDVEALVKTLSVLNLDLLLMDFTEETEARAALDLLPKLSSGTGKVLQVNGRSLGDQVWWVRFLVVWAKIPLALGAFLEDNSPSIPSFDPTWMTNEKNIPQNDWEPITQLKGANLPSLGKGKVTPTGFVRLEGKTLFVWDPTRPLPGIHKSSSTPGAKGLYILNKNREKYRLITPTEVALLLGRTREEVSANPIKASQNALRSFPRSLARFLVRWLPTSGLATPTKVGACVLPQEDCNEATWMRYLEGIEALPKTPWEGPPPAGYVEPSGLANVSPSLARASATPAKLHDYHPPKSGKLVCPECSVTASVKTARYAKACGS